MKRKMESKFTLLKLQKEKLKMEKLNKKLLKKTICPMDKRKLLKLSRKEMI